MTRTLANYGVLFYTVRIMLYPLYHALTFMAAPALRFMTAQRLRNGKEHPTRYRERFGETTIARPNGKVMWCHGASVGESLSALPLLSTLQARLPGWHFVITTNTMTSATLMEERLPSGMTHQFIPWDQPTWVKNFIDHWQPDAALWLESELWPNLLDQIHSRQIPSALLNARMRPKTLEKWRHAKGLAQQMLGGFRFILVGARDYRAGFEELGGRNVRYLGSMKFGAKPLPAPIDDLQPLHSMIGTRTTVGFMSIHAGEDALCAQTIKTLQQNKPDLLSIIAPRDPKRGAALAATLREHGLTVAQRSLNEPITADTDAYIADTMGEMGLWYSLCGLAVMGGSFIPHGGQNPIEGTHFGTAVAYGPHMFNFPELCLALEQSGAAIQVQNGAALVDTLHGLLHHADRLKIMQSAARDLAEQNVDVIDAFADEIIAQLVTAP